MTALDGALAIAPGIAVIQQPMPGSADQASNCYIIATQAGAIVIDPGSSHPGSLRRWAAGLRVVDRRLENVRAILLTHAHRDHAESASLLRASTGARVLLHAGDMDFPSTRSMTGEQLAEWGVPDEIRGRLLDRPLPPDIRADGDLAQELEFATLRGPLRVVPTPGHTAGHVCFALDEEQILFTGDHVLPDQFPGAGVGGWFTSNPLQAYLRSLAAMTGYAGWTGYPGHGSPMADLSARADEIALHHRRRTDEVHAALAASPGASVWQLAERVRWRGGFGSLDAGRMLSALRQTAWHVELASGPDAGPA